MPIVVALAGTRALCKPGRRLQRGAVGLVGERATEVRTVFDLGGAVGARHLIGSPAIDAPELHTDDAEVIRLCAAVARHWWRR